MSRNKAIKSANQNKLTLWVQKVINNPIPFLVGLIVFLVLFSFIKKQLLTAYNWLSSLLKTSGSTITDEVAQYKATKLFQAMTNVGTNIPQIKMMLIGTTKADFYKIAQFFGLKNYAITGSPTFGGTPTNLQGWLLEELSQNEINELNEDIPYLKSVLS